jgi:hypothetical protein
LQKIYEITHTDKERALKEANVWRLWVTCLIFIEAAKKKT